MSLGRQPAVREKSAVSSSAPQSPEMPTRHIQVHKGTVIAFVLINLLLIVACLLALGQIRALRNKVAGDMVLLTPRRSTLLPALTGTDWTGAKQTMAFGQDPRPTLIYTFSKECPYCKENWHALRSLQSLAPQSVRIIYIDGVGDLFAPEYVTANGIGGSLLLVQLSGAAAFAYKAPLMPQTILADRNGRVQWAHIGELRQNDISEVVGLVRRH